MRPRTTKVLSALAGLALLGLLAGVLFLALRGLWRTLVGVNPQLAVALITAGTMVCVATVTVMLGRFYERKREIEAHFRTEKIKIYDEFLHELFRVFHGEAEVAEDEAVKFLQQWQRKLVLWGGSDVLRTYFRWMVRLKRGNPDAQTLFLMDEFFRALRSDIGQSSRGLDRGAFAHLVLRHGEFFLDQARRNPSITLEELGQLERERFGAERG